MFGYIVANEPELKIGEYRLYRSYYCGLCRDLKDRYGSVSQLTLSYDTTFLSFLLTCLYEPEEKAGQTRCIAHPFEEHPTRRNEFTQYCADITVLLSYWSCLDNWADERSLKSRAMAGLLEGRFRLASERRQDEAEAIEKQLKVLHDLEKEGCQDLDLVSGAFGELMAELFAEREDEWSPTLRKMGFYLGKYIYLLDAYDDLDKDRERGAYNVLLSRCHETDFDDRCMRILTMMMAECCSAFETLPIVENLGILRNILYAGVWTRFDEIRDRRSKARQEGKPDVEQPAGSSAENTEEIIEEYAAGYSADQEAETENISREDTDDV